MHQRRDEEDKLSVYFDNNMKLVLPVKSLEGILPGDLAKLTVEFP